MTRGRHAGAAAADGPLVVVEALSKVYPARAGDVHAVRDASFSVPGGSVTVLTGRSGSGKTSLLNCVGGLDVPTGGRITVDGVRVDELDERGRTELRRDRISFVFQTFGLVPMLSARENTGLPLRLRRMAPRQREERVTHLLDLVGLSAHADQRPGELSGGQQQRVAVARALAGSPRLLIADEPTGQLDADTGASVLELIRSLVVSEGMTAIISTHDPKALAFADHRLLIADGEVEEAPGAAVGRVGRRAARADP